MADTENKDTTTSEDGSTSSSTGGAHRAEPASDSGSSDQEAAAAQDSGTTSSVSSSSDEADANAAKADPKVDSKADSTTERAEKKAAPKSDKASKADRRDRGDSDKKEKKGTGKKVLAGVNTGVNELRTRIGTIVWLLAVLAAVVLAVGALLISLDANTGNAVVDGILNLASQLDGPFNRKDGIFTFGKGDAAKSALVNWGIAALLYLVVGRVLQRLIQP